MNRKLRMGMVGGGSDAFIGAIHRLAAFMDTRSNWFAGALVSILRFRSLQGNRISCLIIAYINRIRRCSRMR